jgi:hypothetical protein
VSYDEFVTGVRNLGKMATLTCVGLGVLLVAGCSDEREYKDASGLTVTRLDPELEDRWGTAGVVVKASSASSGLNTGDLITHVVSRTVVSDEDSLTAALRRAIGPQKAAIWNVRKLDPSDASALLEIERDGETLYIELATVEPKDWEDHGMALVGTRIQDVIAGFAHAPARSPAKSAGLVEGDRIIAVIDEQEVPNVKEFRKAWETASGSAETYVYTHELTGIRLEAISALGLLGGSNPAAMNRLIEILQSSSDPAMRRTAARGLEALSGSQDGPTLLRAMLPYISDDEADVEIRRSAINMVESLAARLPADAFDDASIDLVAAAMNDEDPGVHFKAGVILGTIGDRAAPVLLSALEDTSSLRAQDIAATALGDIGGVAGRRALVSALGATANVPLQLTIATALAKISDGPARDELQALLGRTENSGVREFVRQLLDAAPG